MYRTAVRAIPGRLRPAPQGLAIGKNRVFLGLFRPLSAAAILRYEPFPVRRPLSKDDISHLPKYKQWAIYFNSREFKKSMTYYYICAFGALCVAFYFYMRDRYYEDKQLRVIRVKYDKDPSSLLEYEYLKLKALSSDKLKPREERKYRIYQMMRKEYRRQHFLDGDAVFNPSPEELDEWFAKQARPSKRTAAAVAESAEDEPEKVSNTTNASVVQPEDTTAFFEEKAAEYDDEIKWEERGIMMGKRRRWLMTQLQGDVLEVACGTGRNIPYLDTERVNSVTFLDSSANMVKLAQKKFREKFPKYARAAFTVGKAEDLLDIAAEDLKYDTIVEAFGLCAHEDPVAALKNMRQLLRPGGRIVLLEHGRGTWDFVNNHLDFRANKRMKTWACRWNLDIGELVDDAGLDITYEKRVHLGTTWMLVCKRPEDEYRDDEKPFYNRLFGREVNRIKKE